MIHKLAFAALLTVGTASAQADEHIKLLLDWFVNPNHAPIVVAQAIGAFKEAGLDVEIIPPADPSMPPPLLAAGQADLAIGYQPNLYLLADKDLPIERVGTLISSPLNTVTALSGGSIKSMKDLAGKKIGYSVSGIEESTVFTMLRNSQVDPKKVELVNVNYQLVTALLTHQVDAVVGAYRNFEITEIKDHGETPLVFNPEENGVPAYDELIVLAQKRHAKDPKITKFLAAMQKGIEYMDAHPQKAWDLFIKAYPDLDTPLNKTAWAITLPLFARDPFHLDVARYEAYGKFLVDNKVLDKAKPIGELAVELPH